MQASIPLLVSEAAVMPANAIINMVSSLSGLLGPALGGIAYGLWGITPILYVCMGCFFLSAVMEIFIHIPFVKRVRTDTLLHDCLLYTSKIVRFLDNLPKTSLFMTKTYKYDTISREKLFCRKND